jgi:hypothetical protein
MLNNSNNIAAIINMIRGYRFTDTKLNKKPNIVGNTPIPI